MKISQRICLVGVFTFSLSSHAAMLNVDSNGILLGARNVLVKGVFYDVQFKDGSYNSAFVTPRLFNDQPTAGAASQALLDQVLLDGPAGMFDSMPALTFGCLSNLCSLITPWAIGRRVDREEVLYDYANNTAYSPFCIFFCVDKYEGTATYLQRLHPSGDVSYGGSGYGATWAVWSVAATEVPVPAAGWLFGSTLIGLAAFRRGVLSKRSD